MLSTYFCNSPWVYVEKVTFYMEKLGVEVEMVTFMTCLPNCPLNDFCFCKHCFLEGLSTDFWRMCVEK